MNLSPDIDLDQLPDDPHALRRIIARQAAEKRRLELVVDTQNTALDDKERLLCEKDNELKHQALLIEKLKHQLSVLKRQRFGASSEKLAQEIAQLELMIEELESDCPAPCLGEPEANMAPVKKQPVRLALPDTLPRQEVVHTPGSCSEGCCSTCGGNLHAIGEDVLEQLEYVPASFKVVRHVRPKLACRCCESITQAPAPDHAIERGKAGPGLLAHILMSKYADHLPLYRQSGIYARQGITLPRSTMADWVGQVGRLLEPLHAALARHVLAQKSLHGDDTPVPVLSPGKGRTATGRLWAYVYDGRPRGEARSPAALFRYSADRKGERVEKHLKDFSGLLHADGYAGFDRLYRRRNSQVTEVACWAHVRRKFYDVHQSQAGPITSEVLSRIGKLYEIEKAIRGDPPDARQAVRQQKAVPVLDKLKDYLTAKQRQLSRKSALAQAIGYALKRWAALCYYTTDGTAEIDNNAAERAIRPIALGRKNWLFAGSHKGGERAALIYSLIETAKMNDVNPEVWLADVLDRINGHAINKIDDLLPWHWQKGKAL